MTRYFTVILFVLVTTHVTDAREPWPPKGGLGHDLPKELSAAYRFASNSNLWKFPYPDDVQNLFYDFDVRIKFWFMTARMIDMAKRGNGKVLPEDQPKFKAAVQNFFQSLRSNRKFARMSDSKQKKIALAMHDFASLPLAAGVVTVHSLNSMNEMIRHAEKQKKAR
ncbi:MAG: hypothetical protein F4Y39_08550 [Gemmatimonadetes bacterium]|nr:hypothetical protein [Gemmatimonadota bacterium]MYK51705.1 hypothetical protein [Gemmatimonadota bacterium]